MRGITQFALVTMACLATAGAALAAGAAPVSMTPDQMKWVANPAAQGVLTAAVWGDAAQGAHGAFHKFTAGFTAPLHTHSGNNKIVVIAGTMSMTGEDGKEMKFPAGSFYTQANSFKHTTKCLPGADCLVYLESDAAWDLKPAATK